MEEDEPQEPVNAERPQHQFEYKPSATTIIIASLGALITLILHFNFIIETLIKLILGPDTILLGVLILFSIGLLLFLFRKEQQFWYGILEVIFSLFICYISLRTIQNDLLNHHVGFASFASIGSTIYLVVRGLDNINRGFTCDFYRKLYFENHPIKLKIKPYSDYILLFLVSIPFLLFMYYLLTTKIDDRSTIFFLLYCLLTLLTQTSIIIDNRRRKNK